MKKILLIGELNQIIGSLNQYLSTKFQTQMCMDNLEMVKAMRKVFAPDMILVSLIGCNQMDTRIADYFCERYPHMPVMFVGTMEECDFYQKRYESKKFEYLIRPTTLGMLLQKCEIMLNMAESDETDASLENKEEYKEETVQEKKRILAVDDSGIFLRSIKNMLESKYDVIVANSGEIAISQAKAKIPDLILLSGMKRSTDSFRGLYKWILEGIGRVYPLFV